MFVTNFPVAGFLSYDKLRALRDDLICVRVMGWPDGRPALDYTVNAAIGVPAMTGPPEHDGPVNHVLPAWDLLTGAYAAFSMVAAERNRRMTGQGREIRIPLSDLAIASLGHLGQIGEVAAYGEDRPRLGNEIFGAFGRDFATADGKRLMVVAITPRQWTGLLKVLGLESDVAALEQERGVSFAKDEGVRFDHRDALMPLIADAIATRNAADLGEAFESNAVCWSTYRTLKGALEEDAYFSAANPVLSKIEHVSGRGYLAAGFAGTSPGESAESADARAAPGRRHRRGPRRSPGPRRRRDRAPARRRPGRERVTISDADVAAWRGWIGRTETRRQTLDPEIARRYAAAVGSDLDVERAFPPLGHWAYFVDVVGPEGLGADGHPKRGGDGLMPPITLPRRMFAAGALEFVDRSRCPATTPNSP